MKSFTTKVGTSRFDTFKVEDTSFNPRLNIKASDIYKAYRRPSVFKIRAWEYWKQFAIDNGYNIGIGGFNCMKFTVYLWKQNEYCWITADHNRRYIQG